MNTMTGLGIDVDFLEPVIDNDVFFVKCLKRGPEEEPRRECKIQILVRDITQEKTDLIVHPTNEKIDFKGGVGRCLKDTAGQDFVSESKAHGRIDTIRVSGSGQLPCKGVAHINVHKFTHQNEGISRRFIDYLKRKMSLFEFTTLGWDTTYLNCLSVAEENSYSSISIPVLGSGKYGVPADISAAGFLQALITFMVSTKDKLELIRIVTLNQTTCDVFQGTVRDFCDFLESEKRRHEQDVKRNEPKDVIAELHALLNRKMEHIVGLENMKDQLLQFSTTCALNMIRKQQGIQVPLKVPVMLFIGNPGTGKTSIATIISEILHETKLTTRAQLFSAQREDLVGKFIGHTAQQTREVIDKARGATLLIDEVYRLVPQGTSDNDYGPEALDTIMGVIEGDANTTTDRPAIIFAGYPEHMKRVLDSNQGLRRRITHRFNFADYNVSEIVQIIEKLATKEGFRLTASNAAIESKIRSAISTEIISQHNAGLSGRIYAAAKVAADRRLGGAITTGTLHLTRSVLLLLTEDDFNVAIDSIREHL